MRVKKIEPIILRYPEPNDHDAARMTVLVRLQTTGGALGWGECIAMWPEACAAVATVIREGLAADVTGMDLRDLEAIRGKMKARTWWYGEGGIASMALSGIDMAAWDALGRESGQPLWRLLGGRAHDSLPAIASMHMNRETPADNAREVARHVGAGFAGAKLGFGKKGLSPVGGDPDYDADFVAEVRSAIGGDALLMVDIGNGVRWDAATAIYAANRMVEESRIDWIEEPLHPSDLSGLAELRAKSGVRIATGEREFTPDGYARLLAGGCVDVLGVDPGRAEGIGGFIRVARMCEAHKRFINAHAWSTAVTTAASLHLSIATPAAWVFELKPLESPMQHELPETPLWHQAGRIHADNAPGLGVNIRESVLRKYRVGK
ncbi:MAG: mandelate racemase/muconate lactonizing enzyme family protein [Gammaproteobacteria bacterium]|nr:mandelate racemase/muconate lactonizing enzyme family protein [Gammaproteobacteria bacterium]